MLAFTKYPQSEARSRHGSDGTFAASRDPALREKLTPTDPIGRKRVLISNDFYRALVRPNVEVITDGINEVCDRDRDRGRRNHEVDAIIFGTGFQVDPDARADADHRPSRPGLREAWRDGCEAYLGTASRTSRTCSC